jgi:hypothetical protein
MVNFKAIYIEIILLNYVFILFKQEKFFRRIEFCYGELYLEIQIQSTKKKKTMTDHVKQNGLKLWFSIVFLEQSSLGSVMHTGDKRRFLPSTAALLNRINMSMNQLLTDSKSRKKISCSFSEIKVFFVNKTTL